MVWVRLEDGLPDHPKIDAAGGDAAWLHVCALAYCNRNLTDGYIPADRVPRLSDRKRPLQLAERLVDVGLWHRLEDGYTIHDFLDYNPTRAAVLAGREERHAAKVAAGRLGGLAKAQAQRKQTPSKRTSRRLANGKQTPSKRVAPSHSPLKNELHTQDRSLDEPGDPVDISGSIRKAIG
jgi:hypothetical protein